MASNDTTSKIALTGGQIPRRTKGAVQAEVDGELILLSPKDFTYFGARGAGAPVWELIDGARTIDAIIAELEHQYQAEPGVIREETLEYLDALLAVGLIEA